MENKKTLSFQIKNIEILDVQINLQENKQEDYLKDLGFNISIQNKFDFEKELILSIPKIEIHSQIDNALLGLIRVNCIFHIPHLSNHTQSKDTSPGIPEQLLLTLNAVSLSTTRGVMFSQFKGTFLQSIILPVIDPSTLKRENK